jgi:hypothetical protein
MEGFDYDGAAVEHKRRKARGYAEEQDRFVISSLNATMRSDHGERTLRYEGGAWTCSCEFFTERSTCSHTMALEEILAKQAGLPM